MGPRESNNSTIYLSISSSIYSNESNGSDNINSIYDGNNGESEYSIFTGR